MDVFFLTGFPGFLGRALLPRLLARDEASRVVCLVQSRWAAAARRAIGELGRDGVAGARDRIHLDEGDLTRPGLGMAAPVPRDVTEVWHLAAVYDLAVDRATAAEVNVEGTRRVLEACARLPALRRLHHVSTCYVSGRHRGPFRETDLDVGQGFHNAYEETKYRAEVSVRRAMEEGLPATVHRPTVVVGDRATGATSKYDGPYHVVRLLLRQGRVAFLPVPAGAGGHPVNVVPRDWVVEAMARLAARDDTAGRTFHLAEPRPATVDQIVSRLRELVDARVVRVPVPRRPARWALRHLPGAERLTGIPAELLDYFVHPGRYATEATRRALRGFTPPPFTDYLGSLVAFVRDHPEVPSAGMW